MSTGLTNTHTARGFSDLYHVFARKQCILCSALRHGCLTLLYVTSIRDFFAPGTTAQSSIRQSPRSFACSRGCSLAIIYNPLLALLWVSQLTGTCSKVKPNSFSFYFLPMISSGSGGVLVVLPRKSSSLVSVKLNFMQLISDHSRKDRTSVSDSSKPTLASIGKLTVISFANLTRRFLFLSTALISLIKGEKRIGPRTVPWGTPLFIETYLVR